MLLKLRRICYTGSRLPWANSGIEIFAEASIYKAQPRGALRVRSKCEMESKGVPVINTGGSDSRHPTRLANTGRGGVSDYTRPIQLGYSPGTSAQPLAEEHLWGQGCGAQPLVGFAPLDAQ